MRWSRTFIPTLRDTPANVERRSHQLLIRGGFMRQTAGTFTYLPLGQRTMLKISRIVREELDAAGAQEFFLPPPPPGSTRKDGLSRTGERDGPSGFAHGSGEAPGIGKAHEEIFAEIARRELRSYKDLPQIWYRIQAGIPDDDRTEGGAFRTHALTMNDSCSFDVDRQGQERSYEKHRDTYCRILRRCGVKYLLIDSSPGTPWGCRAQELVVPMEAGGDPLLFCSCGYAARPECAASRIPKIVDLPASGEPKEVPTPGRKTIAEIAEFLNVPPTHQIKSLVYLADGKPCLLLLRGDHQLSGTKAVAALKSWAIRPALAEEIQASLGADAGSLGPVGIAGMPLYADLELQGRQNLACGANKNDYHLLGVTPEVHFRPAWADLRMAEKDEACVLCGKPLGLCAAMPVACIRQLEMGHSERSGVAVLLADGKQVSVLLGGYGMKLDNIMLSAVELGHDADGIIWPASIAPFTVVITPINYRGEMKAAADRIHADLQKAGVDTLVDDREERPGVKFKDADLIGVPFRVVLGPEKVKQGRAELFVRSSRTTEALDLASLIATIRSKLETSNQL